MRIASSVLAVFVAAALATAVAGCGADDGGRQTAQPEESMSSTSPGSGSSSFSPSPFASSPSGGSDPSGSASRRTADEMTLTGRPEEGVESGCIVMRSGDRLYLLVGGDRRLLQSGQNVTVRGKPNPGLMTTCQQGTPFEVSEVRVA